MSWLKPIFVGGALTLATHLAVQAADLPSMPTPTVRVMPPSARAPEATDWGSSWYLRGDIAWTADAQPEIAATLLFTGVTQKRYGWAGDIGVGYHLNHWLRTDITYGIRQRQTGFSSIIINHSELMANSYIDIGTWGGFTPFIGAGVGAAFRKADSSTTSLREKSLAWAIMLGVGWNLSENMKLDLAYRYIDMGKVSGVLGGKKTFSAHEARLGVRYMFP